MSTTAVAKQDQTLAEVLRVPKELQLQLLTDVQKGWLRLATIRMDTFEGLQKDELAVQGLLKDITNNKDLKAVQEVIKQAKEVAATSKERRLHFTKMLDEKLITPSMEFEKRNAALLATAANHELELRKVVAQAAQAGMAKQDEIVKFKAHVENEYFRVAAEYRHALNNIIVESYKTALGQAKKVKELPKYIKAIEQMLKDVKLGKYVRFERRLVGDKEAAEIGATITPYDPKQNLADAIKDLHKQFEMYEQDLQNAAKAIKNADKVKQQKDQEINSQLETDIATTNLVAQAGTSNIVAPVIKKKYELEVENTDEWAVNVIGTFLASYSICKEHIRVKTLDKLSVGQMGEALAKIHSEGKLVNNKLKFKVIEK